MAEKIAPVQGYAAGIPWSMHLRAYDAYCKKYGPQQALIEGWCRGGFGTSELDMFIPGWREELSEMKRMAAKIDRLEAERAEMLEALKTTTGYIEHMAAFFGGKGLGYSFESLGEDMPGVRAILARATADR